MTQENKKGYVTKIARDAIDEYNTAVLIKDSIGPDAQDIGIFPVGHLQCNISRATLGPNYKAILERCKIPFKQTDFSIEPFKAYHDYVNTGRSLTRKRRRSPDSSLEGGRNPIMCAFNVPKFAHDLHAVLVSDTTTKGLLPPTFTKNVAQQLISKLKILHSAGFAHLDIKPTNVAIDNRGGHVFARYFDWGFSKDLQAMTGAEIGRLLTSIRNAGYRRNLLRGHLHYITENQEKLEDDFDRIVDRHFTEAWRQFEKTKTKSAGIKLLEQYDIACLMGSCVAAMCKYTNATAQQFGNLYLSAID